MKTGTSILTLDIIDTKASSDGYEIRLHIDLYSGYELEDVKMKITFEDLAAIRNRRYTSRRSYML